jgi:DNA-binding NarL/FixJ family response regulator
MNPTHRFDETVPGRDSGRISLLVADDHPLIRSGLAALVATEPSLALLGQAVDAVDVVEQYARLRPDVALLDLNMPRGGGLEAIAGIRALEPQARIVILTAYDGEDDVQRALAAGAGGYLVKHGGFEEILHCVREVAAGRSYLPPALARKLAGRIGANQLSRRELEILAHLSAGKSNKLIARAAGIGVGTVKYHVNNILSKLNVSCRTEAACVALRRGLVHPY